MKVSPLRIVLATGLSILACVTGEGTAFMPTAGRYRYHGAHAVQDVQVVSSSETWALVFLRSDSGVPPYCELRASIHACEQALAGRELVTLLVASDSGVFDFTSGSCVLPRILRLGEFWRHGTAPDGGVVRRIVELDRHRVVVLTEEILENGHTEELVREEFVRGLGLTSLNYAGGPSVRIVKQPESELWRDAG